jgi:hypothetical protein
MERVCEEAKTEESACGSARPVGRPGTQRSQEARQQTKRPQGWLGQKPQEDYRRQAQRSTATTRSPQERVNAAISSIHARFGKCAIGLGCLGIRYVRVRLEPTL